MFLEIIFLILFLVFFVFFVAQAYNMVFRGYAPFLATKSKVIARIVDEVALSSESVVYELGSGRAGFLRALKQKHPKTKMVGFEYSLVPYVIGQIQNAVSRCNLILKRQNIFKVDLGGANVIYCYLNQETMEKLEPKIKKECKPGTTIVSNMFQLPNMQADKVLEWDGKPDKVYIYKIG